MATAIGVNPSASYNPGGNPTGYNIPGSQAYSADPIAHVVGTGTASLPANPAGVAPVSPFSAFGGGPVNIPGASTSASAPNGTAAYTSGLDPNLIGQLTGAFGEGAGDSLYNFLSSGAGYNPQVAQQLLAQFQPQIAKGSANIMSEFGAAGMGNSSSAGIAEGSYQAQMANDENTLLAQLYEQGNQNYMNMLEGVSGVGGGGTNVGNTQTSTMQNINNVLGDVSKGAGALKAAGVGGGAGTIATILSILGGL
jgi:hypothetical protein